MRASGQGQKKVFCALSDLILKVAMSKEKRGCSSTSMLRVLSR